MSIEKQIEEMANEIMTVVMRNRNMLGVAETLYNKGYRKQSEVIEEYRKRVNTKMEKYTVFGREYIQRIMREVAKEMKGGAEQ